MPAVEPALTSLKLSAKFAARDVAKVIKSALANLEPGSDVFYRVLAGGSPISPVIRL